MATYRPEFVEALKLLGAAFNDVVAAGYKRPVLVGGGAVEYYTGGAITSGDFDIVTAAQQELEQALLRQGFERPRGLGVLLRGLLHPVLHIGVEVVSGTLFDGASDEARVRVIPAGTGEVAIAPLEDMIADRMGQYHANPAAHGDMLDQAIALYRTARSSVEIPMDREYLDRRIKQETLDSYGLHFLRERADDPNQS